MDDYYSMVAFEKTLRAGDRLGVLVANEQASIRTETGQQRPAVTTSAECAVGVHTIGTHGQALNGFCKQYRSM